MGQWDFNSTADLKNSVLLKLLQNPSSQNLLAWPPKALGIALKICLY